MRKFTVEEPIEKNRHNDSVVVGSFLYPLYNKITNKEFDVYMTIDFYHKNLKVPGQELFGEMPGYFGDRRDSRKWLITDAEIDGKIAHLSIINDYGSEDLVADLIILPDGTYELQQRDGSSMKIARNRKWVKIPKKLVFTKEK